jgi:Protein of unknown function (DUF2442)
MLGTPSLPEATDVRFDDDSMWVTLSDGRTLGVPLVWYPRLLNGSREAREDFFISPSGIHWDSLDEDVSIEGMLFGWREVVAESRKAA